MPTRSARLSLLLFSILLLFGMASMSCSNRGEKQGEVRKPNILLIVADDLGYADLGCYGGDIATPNIDGLAVKGIRFSSFHTSPMCAPTRAMLLSGNDNHIAGMGLQGLVTKEFGYEGRHIPNCDHSGTAQRSRVFYLHGREMASGSGLSVKSP